MKKNILTLFLATIFLIPNVKADVLSCSKTVNLFDEQMESGYFDRVVGQSLAPLDNNNQARFKNVIKVNPNTTYYFSSNYSFGNAYFIFLDENQNYLESKTSYKESLITTSSNCHFVSFVLNSNSIDFFWNPYNEGLSWAQFEEGTEKTAYVKWESCDTAPDNPDPPVYDGDQVQLLGNFYTIYLDKLGTLSNYATENYLFLTFIGIILLFIVLEIFLQLFL